MNRFTRFQWQHRVALQIGSNVKVLRLTRGLTKRELANLAGLNPQTITSVESAGKTPNIFTLIRVAYVLEVTVDELIPSALSIHDYLSKEVPQ